MDGAGRKFLVLATGLRYLNCQPLPLTEPPIHTLIKIMDVQVLGVETLPIEHPSIQFDGAGNYATVAGRTKA